MVDDTQIYHHATMTDFLFERADRAREESLSLRIDRRALLDHFRGTVENLRLSVAASQQSRTQSQSRRIREADAKKPDRSELGRSCDAPASPGLVRDSVTLLSDADRTSDAAERERQQAELEEALIWRAKRLHRKNRRRVRAIT